LNSGKKNCLHKKENCNHVLITAMYPSHFEFTLPFCSSSAERVGVEKEEKKY
jgi:hypothetical protein